MNNNYFNNIDKIQKDYLLLLLNKQRKDALILIENCIKNGIDIKDIYIKIFQESQYQIGDLWQQGKISVAQEHYCTAVTQFIMTTIYKYIIQNDKIGKTFLGFCVSEELHDIGIRMVCDMIEMAGFDTIYLGANVPANQIEEAIKEYNVDIVGISVSLATHLIKTIELVNHIKKIKFLKNIKIIVGGYIFNTVPDLWKKVGADLYAKDALEAVEKVKNL